MQKKISLSPESTRCSTCMLNNFCLPMGMAQNDVSHLDDVVKERIRIPKGGTLFRQGDKAEAIYGIRSGSIKTQLEDASGQVQITGFLLAGEIVGIDGFLEKPSFRMPSPSKTPRSAWPASKTWTASSPRFLHYSTSCGA